MQIQINFDDTYEPLTLSDDLSEMTFESPQVDGRSVLLVVQITPHPDPLLPNVYNLGFGPPDGQGGFDHHARLRHANLDKVFSTVLLLALAFLQENPALTIGLDGSNDARARLYHSMFICNREYLDEYFIAIGVDWYVRIFRDQTYEQDADGNYIAKPRPEPFDYARESRDLYRYYMFRLK